MKPRNIITAFVLPLLIFFSCSQEGPKPENKFASSLQRYIFRELPLEIRPCGMTSSGLSQLEPDSAGPDGFIPTYTFKTNGDYYALISLGMADCALPMLTTFTGEGQKIDEKMLSFPGCNSGSGFHCTSYIMIGKDHNIYSCDSITELYTDNHGPEGGKVKAKYIRFKTGKLLSNGKIELSEEKRQDIPSE